MQPLEQLAAGHLDRLVNGIGPRPSGTEGNRQAAAYIRQVFEAAGLEVEMQEFACPAWEDLGTTLEVDGPPLEAAANAYSPPCDVTAPLVPVCTEAELSVADLNGRIAVLYGDLTRAPLSAKSWFLKDERDDRIISLLEAKRPAALLTVQPGLGDLNRLIEDWEFTIPSATVPARTGLALLRPGAQLARLRTRSRQSPGSTANVVARLAGDTPERITLMAHYDTKIDTPGAVDNAAGVAVLLALAQHLAGKKYRYGLEWVAFTNEEYLPIGDDEYLRRLGGSLEGVAAAINFDGVGLAIGATSVAIFSASPLFQELVDEQVRACPGAVWVEPWPQSNHSTFAWRGVPSLAFSSTGAWDRAHLRVDTAEWVSPAKLGEAIRIAAGVIEAIQQQPDSTRFRGPVGEANA